MNTVIPQRSGGICSRREPQILTSSRDDKEDRYCTSEKVTVTIVSTAMGLPLSR